jgi:hypothetical protein
MAVKLARSLSGHDKDRVYVVLKEEGSYVWLADGRLRLMAAPKKKNRRHIQPIVYVPEEVRDILESEGGPDDVRIKRALKIYEKTVTDRSRSESK